MELDKKAVLRALPQAAPFVFLDQATTRENGMDGFYQITGDEYFLAGHFPNRPIFPASIMMEALGQLAIVYLSQSYEEELNMQSIYFLGSEDTVCRRKCLPGDRLDMSIDVKTEREPILIVKGRIEVAGEMAIRVSALKLSFSLGGST